MRWALSVAAVVVLLLAACGDDDDAPEGTLGATPIGTKDATVTAAPDGDGGAEPPDPVEPELDEELTEITRADLDAAIEPGTAYELDPESLSVDAGVEPNCANFQFDFSWQVTEPFPPDGVTLAWRFEREGGAIDVASGPAGNQAVGCGILRAENRGAAPVTVAIRYAIGAVQ
jgi:hypothetical protein